MFIKTQDLYCWYFDLWTFGFKSYLVHVLFVSDAANLLCANKNAASQECICTLEPKDVLKTISLISLLHWSEKAIVWVSDAQLKCCFQIFDSSLVVIYEQDAAIKAHMPWHVRCDQSEVALRPATLLWYDGCGTFY